jgi:hypothetical protein
MNLKDQILAAALKRKTQVFPIKAWGVDAFIRVMTGTERDAWEGQMFADGKPKTEKFRVVLLVKTLADGEGERIFNEGEIATLSEMDSKELDRLFDLASEANGLSKKDVEDLTKKS